MTENEAAKVLSMIPRAIGDLKLIGRLVKATEPDMEYKPPAYPKFVQNCIDELRRQQDSIELEFPELCATTPARNR